MARFSTPMLSSLIAAVLTVSLHAQAPAPGNTPENAPGADAPAQPASEMSDTQKISYAIGLDIGNNFKQQEIEVDPQALSQGIADALGGADPKLTAEEMQAALMGLQQRMRAKQMAQMQEALTKNSEAGKAYLDANAKKEGVKTTASGLQYEELQKGDGNKPDATDIVTVHYTGTLIDGTVFDSSVQRGEPATFALDRVVPGWSEGVQLMSKGAKYRLVIPPDLAYGEQGAPPRIGPNSTLIFEVELIDVQKSE